MDSTHLVIEGATMDLWIFVAVIIAALLLGFVLGMATRRAGGKPWWYDVAFPAPDESTLGAMKVLADRYALGEINADEYRERVEALRKASETPEQRKLRMEREARAAKAA